MKDTKKDAAAVALAHKRTAKLSPQRRKQIAKKAAEVRWGKQETPAQDANS